MALGCHLFGWPVEYVMRQPVHRLAWMLEAVVLFKAGTLGAGDRTQTAAQTLRSLVGR